MEVITEQLETVPENVFSQAANGQGNELFGIWKDRKDTENPEQFVRNMRNGTQRNSADCNGDYTKEKYNQPDLNVGEIDAALKA